MTHMHTLGLPNIPLGPEVGHVLGQLFTSVPKSITKLVLSTTSVDSAMWGALGKALFSKAVALVRNLKVLQMHEWEKFVGKDASACADGLHGMPELKAVLVAEVKVSASFPAALAFHHIPAAP